VFAGECDVAGRGTGSSNPSPSTGESGANLTRGVTTGDSYTIATAVAVRREKPQSHSVLSFLHDEVRKDSDDLMSNTVRVFIDDIDQPRVSQHVVVIDGAHSA
jgi:hypothetical protein